MFVQKYTVTGVSTVRIQRYTSKSCRLEVQGHTLCPVWLKQPEDCRCKTASSLPLLKVLNCLQAGRKEEESHKCPIIAQYILLVVSYSQLLSLSQALRQKKKALLTPMSCWCWPFCSPSSLFVGFLLFWLWKTFWRRKISLLMHRKKISLEKITREHRRAVAVSGTYLVFLETILSF